MSFLTLNKTEDGWEYVSLPQKRTVAVLPFKKITDHSFAYLVHEVRNPINNDMRYEAITGLIEPHEKSRSAAMRELREETGYVVSEARVINSGTVDVARFSDATVNLFFADFKNLEPVETPATDGSDFESRMKPVWVSANDLIFIVDPILVMLYYKFLHKVNTGAIKPQT